ncbi:CdaR family protein [Streptococcus dentapri]|uniref:YbbR-like domain-containing protein n=1 Tax=Streptococcus dentapri TaxID=573564 RepID=A0ABV8D3B5_9STRE
MKNKKIRWSQKRRILRQLGTGIFSLLIAILIFMTVISGDGTNKGMASNGSSSTFSNTLKNVPIDFKYDSDEYYISGYAYGVDVTLTSSNRVNLATETDASTRNFKVTADLTNLREGTSKVQLEVDDLPSGMTAKISPKTVTVTIGKKTSKSFDVKADISDDQLAKGYKLKGADIDVDKVKVTSNETTISQIDHIRATLPDNEPALTDDYEGKVNLQAVDSNGNVLAATIEPEQANLSVDVSPIIKKVPVKVNFTGTMDSSLSSIDYTLDTSTVTIQGDQETLNNIDELAVSVDISNITKNTTKTVKLSAEGVTVNPEEIEVKLTTKKK